MLRIVFVMSLVLLWGMDLFSVKAQPTFEACDDVRYLMGLNTTPHLFERGGGELRANAAVTGNLGAKYYADYWVFSALRPRNANNVAQSFDVRFDFVNTGEVVLEYALFRGLLRILPYSTEARSYKFQQGGDGNYTVVVRRRHVSDERAASYTLSLSTDTPQGILSVRENYDLRLITNVTNNRPYDPAPTLSNGVVNIAMNAQVAIHLDGTRLVNPRSGGLTQVYFPADDFVAQNAFSMTLGNWAKNIHYLAGDFAVSGEKDGAPRVYYLQNFNHRVSLPGNTSNETDLLRVRYPDNTEVVLDWQFISGIWVLDACVGFKLRDGRTFIGATAPTDAAAGATDRRLILSGNQDAFTLSLNALGANGTSTRHEVEMNWYGIKPQSEVRLNRSVFSMLLVGDRDFVVQTTNMRFISERPFGDEAARIDVELKDTSSSITLDWQNMRGFSLRDNLIRIRFEDGFRTSTERDGSNLLRFEALQDIINIIYKNQPSGNQTIDGEQRLLLPAQDSYIEIITPAGLPQWHGRAFPDDPAFMPRALNNLGGDCYPANTLLEFANCPPSGQPNTANGNLWLAFTDLNGVGGTLNLALERSYNSRAHNVDSPFGYGWTTNFLLDYNVAYDTVTNTRPITPEAVRSYRVHLDVTYAPRGIVVFTTASGSRHQFVSQDATYVSGEMRAVTMPGWTLFRSDLRADRWVLRQIDGLEYQFDRAGRLVQYGHRRTNRFVVIDYPRNTLNGSAALGSDRAVIISDALAGELPERRLELYYNSEHRIERAILRDMFLRDANGKPTAAAPTDSCLASNNCLEMRYTYDAQGQLVQVLHWSGIVSSYQYENGQMVAYDDPFAPVARAMRMTYHADRGLRTMQTVLADGSLERYRELSSGVVNNQRNSDEVDDLLEVSLTDELGNTRKLEYRYHSGSLKSARVVAGQNTYTTFALVSESRPFSPDIFEARVPQTYRWDNGLLTQINARGFRDRQGRNGIDIQYTPFGQVTCIACSVQGAPEWRATYDNEGRLTQARYADGSSETFSYDSFGRVLKHVDVNGGSYVFDWSSAPSFLRVTRENDGMVWEYRFNVIGLVVELRQYTASTAASPYLVNYVWDGLGRLVSVSDNVIGTHTMTYELPENTSGNYLTRYVLSDPIGLQTTYVFDEQGRLIRRAVLTDTGFLRLTDYTYDHYGRLTAEIRVLEDGAERSEVATTYEYRLAAVRPSSAATTKETPIAGYQVITTQPSGRQQFRWYDDLGRLRRYVDENNRISDYDYTIERFDNDIGQLGERIEQRAVLSGETVVLEGKYDFDVRRQLRYVELDDDPGEQDRIDYLWRLRTKDNTTRLMAMEPRIDGRTISLVQVLWDDYELGRTSSVNTRQAVLPLISNFNVQNQHRPRLGWQYDFAGRVERVIDAINRVTKTAYCPIENGATRTVYGLVGDDRLSCGSTSFRAAITADAHGRVIAVEDVHGSISIRYEADVANHLWLAFVRMTGTDGSIATWQMRFNGVGELIYWRDEHGTERTYRYDTLGYLRSVETQGSPENSFQFSYTSTGLLTEVKDGLGRGFAYSYNQLEQVVSELNRLTAEATSFAYNASGLLTAVISPSGNATLFQYNDPVNSTRLTGIVEPTGSQHIFEWNDERNQIVYRNPFQNLTGYSFDGTGLLWRIDDTLEARENPRPLFYPEGSIGRRTHEIHYDSAANITEWRWDMRTGSNAPARWMQLNWADGGRTLTIRESNTNQWAKQLKFTPTGELLAFDNAIFSYTPTRQLSQISVGNDLRWRITRQDQQSTLTIDDPFKTSIVMDYDALYRLVRQTQGGASRQYLYSLPSDSETGVVRLDIDYDNVGAREVWFYQGSVRLGTPPRVEVRGFGQKMVYTYTPDHLLSRIEVQICTDDSIDNIEYCFICEDSETPDNPEDCVRRTPIYDTLVTNFLYDQAKRPIRVIRNNEELQTFAYDDVGNLTTYQDENGRTFRYGYDAANRLVSVTSATGIKLLINYNSLDLVTGLCRTRIEANSNYADCRNAGGEIETYAYNRLGQLTTRNIFTGDAPIVLTYAYDASGQGRMTGYGASGSELRMTYNALGQLTAVNELGRSVSLSYHSLNQLAQMDDMAFSYDGLGRLTGYSAAGRRFAIDYDPFGLGYTLQDGNVRMTYQQADNGFLSSISYNGEALWQADGMRMQSGDVFLNTGELVSYTFDKSGRVASTIMFDSDFADVFNLLLSVDARNLLRRYTLQIGALTAGTGETSSGITAVYGYDGDERPFTLRVTDTDNLRVLFTQTYAYSTLGQRERETRQYVDGTQLIFNYTYVKSGTTNAAQLASSTIKLISPVAAFTMNSFAVGGFALAMVLLFWQRRKPVVAIGMILLLGLAVAPLYAQIQREQTYNYVYQYDRRGNLVRVTHTDTRTVCYEYGYDNLGRLTSYKNGQETRSYAYDLYGRLKTVDNTLRLIYAGNTQELRGVQHGNSDVRYFAHIKGQPAPFAIAQNGTNTWLLNDGRYRALQTYQSGDVVTQMWLFDALGRSLTLKSPTFDTFDPCRVHVRQSLSDTALQILPLANGMLWDAKTGLYFRDGRAYDPELGRYLQPDVLGADILGSLYDGIERVRVPLLRDQLEPFIYEGIYRLRDAYEISRLNKRLNAEVVKQDYLPSLMTALNPIGDNLRAATQAFNDNLLDILSLPMWLAQQYNLPAAYVDSTKGTLRLPLRGYGQGGLNVTWQMPKNLTMPRWENALANAIASAEATWNQLANISYVPPYHFPTAYVIPQAGMSTHEFRVNQQPNWWGGNSSTPEDVIARLPRTLVDVETTAYTLDLTRLLAELPAITTGDWIQRMLAHYLPSQPQLPPLTFEAWRASYFTQDALLLEPLVFPTLPELPGLPRYTPTFNQDWLHLWQKQ